MSLGKGKVFPNTVIDLTRCITESVSIMFYVFTDAYLLFTMFSKLFKKADCAVKAPAEFSTILDLAEAWELKIKYA